MSSDIIALSLDLIVLGFLGATIFYVIRLSRTLENFKAQRREFDGVIANLLSSIDQAERSVQSLKQVGAQEASDLDNLIRQSKALVDELTIINETGESMAKRLEKLAERNRRIVQPGAKDSAPDVVRPASLPKARHRPVRKKEQRISSPVGDVQIPKPQVPEHEDNDNNAHDYSATLRNVEKSAVTEVSDIPSFMIQDKEYDEGGSQDGGIPDDLQSQAERELFEALRNNKHDVNSEGDV